MKIFITGAAGYVGGMLTDIFLNDPKVEKVIALDLKEKNNLLPKEIQNHPKLAWITYNLGDDGWQDEVMKEGIIDAVVHCAYIIRQGYGKKRAWQVKSNITAAEKLFDFVFKNKIKKLVHFSTVASYGAFKANKLDYWFKETDPFRSEKYLYAEDKKIIEEKLESIYKKENNSVSQIFIIRPCAISGPRGQFMYRRFGLLQMVKYGLPIVPVTGPAAARQFVHEDDIAEAVQMFVENKIPGNYEIFNIAPPEYILLKDMAKRIGKIVIRIPKWLGWFGYGFLWHISSGKIPTVAISINSYTYPIIVDGSKITKFGFKYKYSLDDALEAKEGRYKKFIGKV